VRLPAECGVDQALGVNKTNNGLTLQAYSNAGVLERGGGKFFCPFTTITVPFWCHYFRFGRLTYLYGVCWYSAVEARSGDAALHVPGTAMWDEVPVLVPSVWRDTVDSDGEEEMLKWSIPVTRMGHKCAAYGRKGRETRIRNTEIDWLGPPNALIRTPESLTRTMFSDCYFTAG